MDSLLEDAGIVSGNDTMQTEKEPDGLTSVDDAALKYAHGVQGRLAMI